jgi:catechol 2,3-dioxygenase-like lactoylglutathione lyase family enzyme
MLHAMDIEKSIAFYPLLGFELIDKEGDPPGWARMHCEGGAIMFLKAEHPIDTHQQGVLFYLYTPDLPELRRHLLTNGIPVPEISYPEYMKSGEICLKDPDGFVVLVGHWGEKEHSAWLERIGRKP